MRKMLKRRDSPGLRGRSSGPVFSVMFLSISINNIFNRFLIHPHKSNKWDVRCQVGTPHEVCSRPILALTPTSSHPITIPLARRSKVTSWPYTTSIVAPIVSEGGFWCSQTGHRRHRPATVHIMSIVACPRSKANVHDVDKFGMADQISRSRTLL